MCADSAKQGQARTTDDDARAAQQPMILQIALEERDAGSRPLFCGDVRHFVTYHYYKQSFFIWIIKCDA